ncbi:hypothetical protein K3495_g11038 [Podosphaera aphanis]|nr:hypothetical protein K3495_g11038 [Podosphaera aphanis]
MPSLILTIFLVQLAIHLVNTVGASSVNSMMWDLWCFLPQSKSTSIVEQEQLKVQVIKLRKELNATSSQDEFAKWAKLRRQHDKVTEQLEKAKASTDSAKSTFTSIVTTIRWLGTNGLRMLIQLWYQKHPVFYIPHGWIPYHAEWLLSFPRAPLGSISVQAWFLACTSFILLMSEASVTLLSLFRDYRVPTCSDKNRRKKVSAKARLLYFQHGPSTIVDCTFCRTDDPKSYFYYSLPILLFPHLLNLSILGVSTSSFFTGRQGSAWRTQTCIVALGGSALDLYLVAKYSYRNNSRAAKLEDIDLFFWKSRIYRFLALALLDGLFAWLLYLSSTGRAFPQPSSLKDRIKDASRTLDSVRSKVFATGVLKNTVVRDENLQTINQQYWSNEVQLTRAIMEEREVIERINDALERRININRIERDAQDYAKDVITSFHKCSEKNE